MPKTLRLIELFAGYGSQAMAIKRLNIPFEHYKVVEFDKYAVRSYNAVHNTNFPVSDIRDVTGKDLEIVETEKYDYLLTYSFPCTDLSVAGKGLGMSKGSNTRSGLLWEVERILKECKELGALPQFLLMENVTQVHGENNIKDFGEWVTFLDALGYISKWQDLNAKDYGIPQNRDRCFMVSYLDKSLKYAFPTPVKLQKVAKDYLEDNVSEKYYINTERAKELIEKLIIENDLEDVITVRANNSKGYYNMVNGGVVNLEYAESTTKRGRVQTSPLVCPTIAIDGYISKVDKTRRVVDLSTTEPKVRNLANCISTAQRGIIKHQAESNGVLESAKMRAFLNYDHIDGINKDVAKTLCARDHKGYGNSFSTMNGVIEELVLVGEMDLKHELARRVYSSEGISPAITTNKGYEPNFLIEYRIRKLTPLECFRLMGVTDSDAKKMLEVNSETQCYKQAGNSIVVDVLEAIFFNMFCGGSEKVKAQLDIFDIL